MRKNVHIEASNGMHQPDLSTYAGFGLKFQHLRMVKWRIQPLPDAEPGQPGNEPRPISSVEESGCLRASTGLALWSVLFSSLHPSQESRLVAQLSLLFLPKGHFSCEWDFPTGGEYSRSTELRLKSTFCLLPSVVATCYRPAARFHS